LEKRLVLMLGVLQSELLEVLTSKPKLAQYKALAIGIVTCFSVPMVTTTKKEERHFLPTH